MVLGQVENCSRKYDGEKCLVRFHQGRRPLISYELHVV